VTRCLNLGEYLWLAEQVTGVDAAVLSKASRADLANSALHAPEASFGGTEFYDTLPDKAAVLVCRFAASATATASIAAEVQQEI
jgi:death-on-curing protein